MVQPLYRWIQRERPVVDRACLELAKSRGISRRLMALLAARGVNTGEALAAFLAPVEEQIHDPGLLPDSEAALARVRRAREAGEKVLVYGDFDADGLTGLSILVLALSELGLDVAPYVPERVGDGHGLSPRAIERAVAEGRTLILTADCGTSSEPEIAAALARDIDVVVTDHHHAPEVPASAVAVVNPQRPDSAYPEKGLTGAGVAWKVAHLLLRDRELGPVEAASRSWPLPPTIAALTDLAVIGTVGDVAPILGENRAIARLGLERLRTDPRPGLAALIDRARMKPSLLDLEDVAFGLAPRLNAAGRVGEADRAARLLMAEDATEAAALADEIEEANRRRRDVTRAALREARRMLRLPLPVGAEDVEVVETTDVADDEPVQVDLGLSVATIPLEMSEIPPALLLRGEWPVGIVGLIAGRLAEDYSRPVIVATTLDASAGTLRASCRSGKALNLAEALVECSELLIRHGGHEAAAGFDIEESSWQAFSDRFLALARARVLPPPAPELTLDLVLSADSVDFDFVREIGLLEPTGPGNPRPVLGLTGLKVVRARATNGGHTQIVLRRTKDVLDCIAFRRPDLASSLKEGDRVDVAARASVRAFGGLETVQLEILDVAEAGSAIQPSPAPAVAASESAN